MLSFTVFSKELIFKPSSFFAFELSIFLGKSIIFSMDSLVRFSRPGNSLPLISAAFLENLLEIRM